MAMNTNRRKVASIPPNHDVLGHPELRDQQGPGDGQSNFKAPAPKSLGSIGMESSEKKGGDFKYGSGL